MKQTWLAVLAFALVLDSTSAQVASRAVWDDSLGQYAVEDGAKILVGVDNEAYAQALADLWDGAHPEALGAVRFVSLTSAEAAQKLARRDWSTPDVVIASASDLLPVAGQLMVLDGNLAKLVNDNVVLKYYQTANAGFSDVTTVPVAYRGLVFGWNQTLLKAWGYDVTPAPGNLPRAFDTWEKIFALAQDWQAHRPSVLGKPANRVFPLPLDSLRRGYFFTTVTGWSIFKEENPVKPGFEKSEFLAGLDFVKAAADAKLVVGSNGGPLPASQLTSRGDELYTDATLPFGLVGTWFEAPSDADNFQFGALPTWKGARPSALSTVRVGAIDGQTNYPSAAAELLRLLYTKKGTQAIVDHSPFLPVVRAKSEVAPDYSQNRIKAQMLAALTTAAVEPINLVASGAEKPAVGVLEDPAAILALQEVWDGTKTPVEAQKLLVAASDRWTAANAKKKY